MTDNLSGDIVEVVLGGTESCCPEESRQSLNRLIGHWAPLANPTLDNI
jgi:hypothetical protein